MVTLGAAAGGVLGGSLVDRAGRKPSLLLCAAPFVVGFAVITAARDVWVLLGGRLLTGLACGVASLVAPVSGPCFPARQTRGAACGPGSPGAGQPAVGASAPSPHLGPGKKPLLLPRARRLPWREVAPVGGQQGPHAWLRLSGPR